MFTFQFDVCSKPKNKPSTWRTFYHCYVMLKSLSMKQPSTTTGEILGSNNCYGWLNLTTGFNKINIPSIHFKHIKLLNLAKDIHNWAPKVSVECFKWREKLKYIEQWHFNQNWSPFPKNNCDICHQFPNMFVFDN